MQEPAEREVLPQPKDLKVHDWEERRRIALEARELGKHVLTPEPVRPVRPSRVVPSR